MMRPLHPNQVWVMRIRAAIAATVVSIAALLVDVGLLREVPMLSPGLVPGGVALLAALAAVWLPLRRYRRWGYRMDEDELHIWYGVWVRVRTTVPFGRVQHLDVAQGPIERPFGLSTLILHTAGTRGASVLLPGLATAEAERMRDVIRARIRQDLV
jgi:uncharacterized protein